MKTKTSLLAACLLIFSGNSGSAFAEEEDAAHSAHKSGNSSTGLVARVREATRVYRDPAMATAAGYSPFLGCVSGNQEGAMGVHFVNGDLVGDNVLDADQPEILVYEPLPNGRMRLVAVEFLVLAEAWHASNPTPPALEGQVFHYNGSPNRYGLPAFYELHVWAWKRNGSGMFVDWNPAVSCEHFTP